MFERAGYKNYADQVRIFAQASDNETDDSSGSGEEQSQVEQPQTYPPHKPEALSQCPPETPDSESTETYVIVDEKNLPEGKN